MIVMSLACVVSFSMFDGVHSQDVDDLMCGYLPEGAEAMNAEALMVCGTFRF